MVSVNDLSAVDETRSDKLGVVFASSAGFIETGYNYLAAERDRSTRGPGRIEGKKKEFELALRETLKAQGITTGPQEFAQLSRDVLNKIADEFKLPKLQEGRSATG